ncbi:MAG: hypothetical protein KGI64_07180, partial [Xanthomonadaceae bacterium]|nr:hypothetical protein [Xanthomonadaceae bacterium]
LNAFRASADAFDSARELVVPFSHRAVSRWELEAALQEVNSSPEDRSAQERYRKALANCNTMNRAAYTREIFSEHVSKMQLLTECFFDLTDSAQQIPESSAEHSLVVGMLKAESRLYRLEADAFDSAARMAYTDALIGTQNAFKDAIDDLAKYLSNATDGDPQFSADDDARLEQRQKYFGELESMAQAAIARAEKYIELADTAIALVES